MEEGIGGGAILDLILPSKENLLEEVETGTLGRRYYSKVMKKKKMMILY